MLPANTVISSGGTRRYGAKTLGSNETQSREISCHHGLATFRGEISPLCFAFVEMTGRYHLERRNAPVWVARTLGSHETQSREISCHHGLATFRSEISPLRFAAVEMTGRGAAFGGICLSANDCMLPAAIVISSGAACRYE